MFDRLFNILKAEIGDVFQGNEKITKEDWELYEQFYNKKNEKPNEKTYDNIDEEFEKHFKQQNWQEQQEEKQYYAALELSYGASFEEIKVAYKRLIKQYHPDRFPNDPDKHKAAIELSQKLNIAYGYFEKKFGK
jgi:DnaJ-domain-containing protein 1